MSLVNQMLKDLEQRRADLPPSDNLQGLRAAPTSPQPQRRSLWLASLAITGVVGAGIGWYSHSDAGLATTAMVPEKNESSQQTTPLPLTAGADAVLATPTAVPVSANAGIEPAAEIPAVSVIEAQSRTQESAGETRRKTTSHKPSAKPNVDVEPAPEMRKTTRALSPTEQAEQEYANALNVLQRGDTREAEHALRAALELSPTHSEAAEHLAVLLLQQGRKGDALDVLRTALTRTYGQPQLSKLLARLLADEKQDVEALAILQKARDSTNGDGEFFALLAALQQRQQQHSAAVTSYREALALDPKRGAWWLGLGISLEQMQRMDEALAAYSSALQDRALTEPVRIYVRDRLAKLENPTG